MSVTYTVDDWLTAMNGVQLIASAPGELPQSTTLTARANMMVANGEFGHFVDTASLPFSTHA